jgi:hypothetical protein
MKKMSDMFRPAWFQTVMERFRMTDNNWKSKEKRSKQFNNLNKGAIQIMRDTCTITFSVFSLPYNGNYLNC